MQLDVPEILVNKQDVIQKGIAEIFKKNGMGCLLYTSYGGFGL